jgi:glutamate formiminotransferase / formiminotetrahydrofolate cyclodeaminase
LQSDSILECVPNFSEGRDLEIIRAIAQSITRVEGVRLLHIDPGWDAHRTVYTFVGPPDRVCEAAFRSAQVGSNLIDMSRHHGEHPRLGALDVCPLIPVRGMSIQDADDWAKSLAQRLGEQLGLTVYLYEHSARKRQRETLFAIRKGGYEGLSEKLKDSEWKPDFGPDSLNPKSGATVVGAREYLVALNINLDSKSAKDAEAIARAVRESGGGLKGVRAIGWMMHKYGFAQVSTNITRLSETPVHAVFEAVKGEAAKLGLQVTGSELIGLIPLQAMLGIGCHCRRGARPRWISAF